MYKAKVKEAEAQLAGAKAALVQAEAEFTRQETLLRQNVSAQATFDIAKAKRDSARANVENAEGNLTVAQTNLGYTTVLAPFDGIVTKHLVTVGELVGNGVATKLATIVQLDPIYVDVQHERAGRPADPRESQGASPRRRGTQQDPAQTSA